jgi:hypothetical protein
LAAQWAAIWAQTCARSSSEVLEMSLSLLVIELPSWPSLLLNNFLESIMLVWHQEYIKKLIYSKLWGVCLSILDWGNLWWGWQCCCKSSYSWNRHRLPTKHSLH